MVVEWHLRNKRAGLRQIVRRTFHADSMARRSGFPLCTGMSLRSRIAGTQTLIGLRFDWRRCSSE